MLKVKEVDAMIFIGGKGFNSTVEFTVCSQSSECYYMINDGETGIAIEIPMSQLKDMINPTKEKEKTYIDHGYRKEGK